MIIPSKDTETYKHEWDKCYIWREENRNKNRKIILPVDESNKCSYNIVGNKKEDRHSPKHRSSEWYANIIPYVVVQTRKRIYTVPLNRTSITSNSNCGKSATKISKNKITKREKNRYV